VNDSSIRRSPAARIGVAALNLFQPGLGLIRVGRWKAGWIWIAATWAFLLLLFLLAKLTSPPPFSVFAAIMIVMILTTILSPIASIIWTWRASRTRLVQVSWQARWYAVTAIAIAALIVGNLTLDAFHAVYRPFSIPAESMAPTLLKNDKIMGDMRWRAPRIGDLVIFRRPGANYIKRIAALGGQTIALEHGVPVIDGKPALQKQAGSFAFVGFDGPETGARLAERLPGEAGSHFILDLGPGAFDDAAPVRVPPGFVFVLGDNRDQSADSRVPLPMGGVGLVPVGAIMGRPLYMYWSSDRSRIGPMADH
jgi:signal peptidase I